MLRQCFSSGTTDDGHTGYKAWPSPKLTKITTYDHVHQIFITSCTWFRRGVLCDLGFRFPVFKLSKFPNYVLFIGLKLQFEVTEGFEIMHKDWYSLDEVPYCFPRSSIKFLGYMGWKISDLNQVWVRLLGWSQLSNPSDLPCLFSCKMIKQNQLENHFGFIMSFLWSTFSVSETNCDLDFLKLTQLYCCWFHCEDTESKK